jgi:hypothetical protein
MFIGIKLMKKLAFATALLGAGLIAQSAQAAVIPSVTSSLYYVENNPANSSYTITLSGECSGKITLPVTRVSYGRQYDYTGSIIDRDGSYGEVYFYTDDSDIYAYGENEGYIAGDKLTESVKKGQLSLKMLVKSGYAYPNMRSLEDGFYNNRITCKSGLTLAETLIDWNTYISYDAPSFKSIASLSHTNSIAAPNTGKYKAKFFATGEIEQPGQCTIKGELFSVDYSLVCAPPKVIKVKVAASASGTSQPD